MTSTQLHRRQFTCGIGGLAGALLGRACWNGQHLVSAAEPILRSQPAKFMLSLAAYSYRDLFADAASQPTISPLTTSPLTTSPLTIGQPSTVQPSPSQPTSGQEPSSQATPPSRPAPVVSENPKRKLTLFDFIDDCARFGIHGAELTSYYFPDPLTQDTLYQLKRHAFLRGIDISGTAIRSDFALPPGPLRDAEMAHVRTWIDRAALLGAPVIRIFAGQVGTGQSPEQAHALIVSGIKSSCDYAAQHGIWLALENHGGPTSTAEGLLAIVRDVPSDWLGVNLDTGNFQGSDPYTEIERCAPWAINVQVKVAVSNSAGQKEPTDFARIFQILRKVNYQGYVVLEFEEAGDPQRECERFLHELKKAMQL